MSGAMLGRPFALLAGTALVAFLGLRLSTLPLADSLLPWMLDTVATAVLLLATVAGCGYLAARTRRHDRENARVEHLAEVGLMAGGLAHEVRNTLNAMHSQIALLRKHLPPDPDGQLGHRLGRIERAVVVLEELVSEFLAYARPASDNLQVVELAAVVRGVLDFVALDLEQAQVTPIIELPPGLPSVYADEGKLKRALLNLVINARQAMPEGGTLTIRGRASGRNVVIEVSDTGCGISEKDRPHIFQSFFSTRPDGTGLGLAVVKRTVEDLGGRITFDSQVGRGTTFRISLPRATRRHGQARKAPSPSLGAPVG